MGYFANSEDGAQYEQQWCDRCVHQMDESGGCAVMTAHLLRSYEECNKQDSLLNVLIPRNQDGENLMCRMFKDEGELDRPCCAGLHGQPSWSKGWFI